MQRLIPALALLFCAIALVSGCSKNEDTTDTATPAPATGVTATPSPGAAGAIQPMQADTPALKPIK
jgi:hypothetical protein